MSRDDGLVRADTDTNLYGDPKVKRLWRQVKPDVARMTAAMVLYEATRLDSARTGERVPAEDAAPGWMVATEEPRDDLIAAELLDPDGRLPQHAYDAWIGEPIERLRKQREVWRGRKGGTPGESSRKPPGTPEDSSTTYLPSLPTKPSIPTLPTLPPGGTDRDSIDAYFDLTGSRPSKTVIDWLAKLEGEFGIPRVTQALADVAIEDPSKSTLLSRAENRLWEAHRAAEKVAERERTAREAERIAAEQARLNLSPEQVAANRARLREELSASGLLAAPATATRRRRTAP